MKNDFDLKNKINKRNFSKFNAKIFIAFLVLISILVFGGLIVKNIVIPANIYSSANEAYSSGDYEKAINLYSKQIDYKDSKLKLQKAYISYGIKLSKEKNFDKAIEILEKCYLQDEGAKKYLKYSIAGNDVKNKQLANDTIQNLYELGDFEDSGNLLREAYYIKADDLKNSEKYNDAIKFYKKSQDFRDANEKIKKCQYEINGKLLLDAEECYKDGELNRALKKYKLLPNDFEYNGIKVKERLKTLNKYKYLVNLCGTWVGKNGKFSVRQIHDSTGLWDQWDNTYKEYLYLKCFINNDGTVTLEGEASYYTFTNYSSLSAYLDISNYTETFCVKAKHIPKTVYNKDNVKITFVNNKFNLIYDYKDENSSMDFTYRYKSSITFNKK